MRELRRAIRMPIGLPAPAWMVRIGAPLFVRTDPELALYGRYCVSRRLKEEGFEFCFPELRGALTDLFGRHKHVRTRATRSSILRCKSSFDEAGYSHQLLE